MKKHRSPADGLTILLILVALAGGFIFILGIRPYVVLSGSMEPGIPTGSMVFADTRKTSPQAGSVIIYRLGGTLVTHRVVERHEGYSITKGDANDHEDPSPVDDTQIVGEVLYVIPLIGYICQTMRHPLVLCFLLMAVLCLYLLYSRTQ